MAIKPSDKDVRLDKLPELDTFDEDRKEYQEDHPYLEGESELGGTTVDLDSDDDTLQGVHGVGHQPEENLENPKPLDPAGDTEKAEEHKKKH